MRGIERLDGGKRSEQYRIAEAFVRHLVVRDSVANYINGQLCLMDGEKIDRPSIHLSLKRCPHPVLLSIFPAMISGRSSFSRPTFENPFF